jgi:hypothetical protein
MSLSISLVIGISPKSSWTLLKPSPRHNTSHVLRHFEGSFYYLERRLNHFALVASIHGSERIIHL